MLLGSGDTVNTVRAGVSRGKERGHSHFMNIEHAEYIPLWIIKSIEN